MKFIFLLFFSFPLVLFSQFAGDSVFGVNQVIRVDLTFNQSSFWDSLVANYSSETDMLAVGLQITDLGGVHTMDSIAIRLKGNSSYGHPGNKKSFKIDINDYVSGQNYNGLKKLNFNNCFKDPSFMREKLFFDLCQVLQIPAPRVNYANVYMNGTFWGFYSIVEQIDDQFLDWCIKEDLGNLFKAGDNSAGTLPADLAYYGASSTNYSGRYELKTNEIANDWTDLIALIDFVNNTSDTDFEANFNSNFNQTNFLRSLALDNLFSSLDSYLNSARNYYLYHNTISGQWEWIKWDGNEAFGLYTGGPGAGNLTQLAPNYIANNRPLVSNLFANTTLYNLYLDQMCSILDSHFNSSYMEAKADEIKALIQTHVEADNNKMYTDAQFNTNVESDVTVTGGMGGSQTVFGIKSFVTQRYEYLSNLLGCITGNQELNFVDLVLYPNPCEKHFNIPAEYNLQHISDGLGRTIDFKLIQNGNLKEIELLQKSGIYFVELEKNGIIRTVKIVKSE